MASNAPKRRTTKSKTTAAGKVAASAVEPKKKRRKIDWERIELDYRAGVKSLREIGSEHSITEGAIRKRAKRDDWTRDLSARINSKAEQLVRSELVRNEVRSEPNASEREVIDASARVIADVKLAHRKSIRRGRDVTERLLEELEAQVGAENMEALAELGEIMRDPDESGRDRLNDLYQRVISLPERVKTAKTLAETMRINIDLERQAFNMDDKSKAPENPLLARAGSLTDVERAVRLAAFARSEKGGALLAAALMRVDDAG